MTGEHGKPASGQAGRPGETGLRRSVGLQRWWRHVRTGPWQVSRAFDSGALKAIQDAIRQSETRHSAEIRFAVEAVLSTRELVAGLTSRERAWQVFAEHGIWDTQHNNGVLIYLLWADRAVEIVVDRGAHQQVPEGIWTQACQSIREAVRAGHGPRGVISAIEQIGEALAQVYPAQPDDNPDELSDEPLVLR
ncbi:MAG: TPM domain-containing protein [Burkholderiaceae bacterium]